MCMCVCVCACACVCVCACACVRVCMCVGGREGGMKGECNRSSIHINRAGDDRGRGERESLEGVSKIE